APRDGRRPCRDGCAGSGLLSALCTDGRADGALRSLDREAHHGGRGLSCGRRKEAGMSKESTVTASQSAVAPPILAGKHHSAPSAFTAENLLREARRQKGLTAATVPAVCVLDPDGDLVRRLRSAGCAQQDTAWPRYHTDLYRLSEGGLELGLVGCAVGAPFAVLVAEQLFASGCRPLISMS